MAYDTRYTVYGVNRITMFFIVDATYLSTP